MSCLRTHSLQSKESRIQNPTYGTWISSHNMYRLYHEVEVSTWFTHQGQQARGCVNRVETDTEWYNWLIPWATWPWQRILGLATRAWCPASIKAEHSPERPYHSPESQGGKEKSVLNKLLSSSMLAAGSTIVWTQTPACQIRTRAFYGRHVSWLQLRLADSAKTVNCSA